MTSPGARAQATNVVKSSRGKVTVEVALGLHQREKDGSSRALVTGTAHFRRVGALRAM